MYILKAGLSIIISPGNLPKGSLEIHGHNNPAANKIIPVVINILEILDLR